MVKYKKGQVIVHRLMLGGLCFDEILEERGNDMYIFKGLGTVVDGEYAPPPHAEPPFEDGIHSLGGIPPRVLNAKEVALFKMCSVTPTWEENKE